MTRIEGFWGFFLRWQILHADGNEPLKGDIGLDGEEELLEQCPHSEKSKESTIQVEGVAMDRNIDRLCKGAGRNIHI